MVFATAAAFTGMMVAWGCVVWGTGYYYPPYVGYGGGYPDLLPALSDLRVRRVVQPVDRRVHARRRGVRSVRRRRRGAALQPEDRHLLARRGGLRSVRRARRGAGLQPAHRRVRRDAAGLERLRQLGHRPASQRGDQWATTSRVHQQRHRHDDAHDADERGRRGGQPRPAPAARRRSREPAAATSTPATTATSTARRATAGRSTATAAGAASSSRRRTAQGRRPGSRRDRRDRAASPAGTRRPRSR